MTVKNVVKVYATAKILTAGCESGACAPLCWAASAWFDTDGSVLAQGNGFAYEPAISVTLTYPGSLASTREALEDALASAFWATFSGRTDVTDIQFTWL